MPNPLMPAMGLAAQDLGMGGVLVGQTADETEEQRKKRLLQLQQQQMMGNMGSGSLSSSVLFGKTGVYGGSGTGRY